MDGWFAAAVAYPIEAPVIAEGLAVVVHSAGAALRFGPFVPGGATVLPLPFVGQHAASPVPGEARRRLDVPDQRVLVSCIGILNASRRIDLLIDAVAREDLGERLFLLVAGMAGRETEATIRAHADRAGLTADNFRIETGWLPPRRYADVLAATDLFANLRSDHAASGSATVLEQMWASKPVIVLDQGPFRDLPDDAVVKVSPRFAAAELHGHLGRLALDTGTRRRIGERARTHVERHHPVEHYASALVEVLREADRGHARNEIEHQVVDNLERAGVRPDTPAMGAISETMNELFGWSDPPAGVGPVDARHDR